VTLIPGDELRLVSKIFGLSAQAMSGITDLDTGNVDQVLVVNDLARRGKTEANLGGWYEGFFENVHSAADGEVSFLDPYAPGASANAPYPAVVPLDWDVWLLGVGGVQSSGVIPSLTGAIWQVNPIRSQVGWAQDDAGDPVATVSPSMSVARFDDVSPLIGTISQPPMLTEQGEVWVQTRMRLPRGATLEFHTESSAAAEFLGTALMGLFPASLGQDVVT